MILVDDPFFLSLFGAFYTSFFFLYGKIFLNILLDLIKWASSIALGNLSLLILTPFSQILMY